MSTLLAAIVGMATTQAAKIGTVTHHAFVAVS
jgi:hypothetical protein